MSRGLAGAVALVVASSACASSGGRYDPFVHASQLGDAHVDYVFDFEDLPTMMATADLVAEATVLDARPGEPEQEGTGELAEEHAYRSREVLLRIDRVYAAGDGPRVSPGDAIWIRGLGSWDGDRPFMNNGLVWEQRGDRAFYFVVYDDACGEALFLLINHQGRYLISDGRLVGAGYKDGLIRRIERMSPARFRNALAVARGRIQSGAARPEPEPTTICPSS